MQPPSDPPPAAPAPVALCAPQESRQELISDVEDLKNKISGTKE